MIAPEISQLRHTNPRESRPVRVTRKGNPALASRLRCGSWWRERIARLTATVPPPPLDFVRKHAGDKKLLHQGEQAPKGLEIFPVHFGVLADKTEMR